MLFWLFVILVIVGGVWCYFSAKNDYYDIPGVLPVLLTTFSSIGLIISIIIIIVTHGTTESYIAKNQVRYETLVYQYESDIYDYDFSKRNVIDDIQTWNEDVVRCRELQDSFWFGIYYPNIYDQFELIELERGGE